MNSIERERIAAKARSFFDELWARGDPWDLQSSEFERARYGRLLAALDPSRYGRVLEIGSGAGAFTRLLAPRAGFLLGVDVSTTAIAAAQSALADLPQVELRAVNIMDFAPRQEGPWDLIVMSETIYYLGWLYSFFDVCWLAGELFESTRPGGQLLLANTRGDIGDPLLLPAIIGTYRDLFLNAGYGLKSEEIFRGEKNGVNLEVMISLYQKPAAAAPDPARG